ncbi:phosphonate transport system permease protein [Nocardioides marinisabuli]|uniref:Phosphonate transport system permease protein n=1 Tax=Nocardioides marinisabuli TaxID=419476 RepID=A0A7Y9EXI7_9ACTN|nr:ABC transporter permease subunit [Nocardioides marinisabuli]NYD55797.1 phosphonate transport system permease protein [Nocardioides marinisabuli]
MTTLDRPATRTTARRGTTGRTVWGRRLVALAVVVVPLLWASARTLGGGVDLVNTGGLGLVDDLLGKALDPALDAQFLAVVWRALLVTVAFALLGTAGALVLGAVGGLVLSDVAWGERPGRWVGVVRVPLRGVLVAARSIHELVWALLLVSVLGLDPLVAVIAIAVPFGAQTAKVFADTLDSTTRGPLEALRVAGARPVPALAYGLLPGALPLLLSYSFYRLECAIRSAVILGVVGVGGLGQELVVSLQSRNWDEVWTLIGAVLLLSAVVDLWSTRVRTGLAVASCSDWSSGRTGAPASGSRWVGWSGWALLPMLAVAWWYADVSLSGLFSERTRELSVRLGDDLLPPALPPGGWATLSAGVLDTVAMAVLAMAFAVALTLAIGPLASRPRRDQDGSGAGPLRWAGWAVARLLLLVLRSVPPTVWAVVALLALFPGILPGAVALGLYTGGILGRLVAEAWESVPLRPRAALQDVGVPRPLAGLAATVPAGVQPLVTYTLYRFEICVRDTAIVGVVGAAGLGRLLQENLNAFRFPAVTTLLIASFAVSVAAELAGRRIRRALAA